MAWPFREHMFLHVSKIFQKHKSGANKQDCEMKLNLTWKVNVYQPLKQGILTKMVAFCGPKQVILAEPSD